MALNHFISLIMLAQRRDQNVPSEAENKGSIVPSSQQIGGINMCIIFIIDQALSTQDDPLDADRYDPNGTFAPSQQSERR